MDNPAGSVRPNMLYVPAASWLPRIEGEALAAWLALRTGLPAQMRFLEAVSVTGVDPGAMGTPMGDDAQLPGAGAAMALVEAWLTVLLLRHHRARLLTASRGMVGIVLPALPPDETGLPNTSDVSHASLVRSAAVSTLPQLPSCPDLPALSMVLEQTGALLGLLRRERDAWTDPDWVSLLQEMGGSVGAQAIGAAREALEHAARIESMDPGDLFLYGAAVRGQVARVLKHPGMMRMLRGPHVSLAALLHGGATRMLKVNLSGAYRTVALPYSEDDLARKQYGLYLLWSLWAASRQRQAMYTRRVEGLHPGSSSGVEPHPALLVLHGAGAWFGSGSPLSERANLQELGHEASGIAVAVTVSGLRHLRAYRAGASEAFGNLVIGPAPVTELDAPDVALDLAEVEASLLREAAQRIAERVDRATAGDTSLPANVSQAGKAQGATNGSHLFRVLRRIDDGTALVQTGSPGGSSAVCTAQVGSRPASDVRGSWPDPGAEDGVRRVHPRPVVHPIRAE
jgi:hypothetical protein